MEKVMFISAANDIHTVRWVNALSKKFEIHLIYCKNHKPNIDKINERVILHELKFKAPWGYYLNKFELQKLYKQIEPKLINVHYATGYGTLARISKLKPILLSVWGSDVYEFPNKSKLNKKILQKNIMYADYIASTSKVMANELKKQVPMLKDEIFITPFGVDTEKFKPLDVHREDSEFKIGNIKKLEKIYGIEYLILGVEKVISRLRDNNELELANSIKLYIYGDGNQKEQLQDLIEKHNLKKQVFLMGRVANDLVPEKLNQLDLVCVTSLSESFGVAVVEAMACEVPVISSNADGFCEVMENGVTGYIVEKKEINKLAEKIEIMLRNKELRVNFGKNGRKRVLDNYNWKDNVNYMEEVYNKCKK